jgi:hypothetical protein
VAWQSVADNWGEQMVEELKRKTLERAKQTALLQDVKALSLELAHQMPFNWITLKQYRDACHIEEACYQAVVQTTRSITRIYDWREIDRPVHVRIHRYPGHPIVETLGLVVKNIDSTGGSIVENLQPTRPFWMRVRLQEDLGSVIGWRADAGDDHKRWHMSPNFTQAHTPAAAGETPSLYGRKGETRSGSVLGQAPRRAEEIDDVESYARRWLREALVHELAWMRVHLPSGAAAMRAKLRGLSPAQRGQLERLLDDESFLAVCDTMEIDAMLDLTRALARQQPDVAVERTDPDAHGITCAAGDERAPGVRA